MEEMQKLIGDLIRDKRLKKGMTQQQLAEKVGIDKRTIMRAENAQFWLNLKHYILICKVLGIPFNVK